MTKPRLFTALAAALFALAAAAAHAQIAAPRTLAEPKAEIQQRADRKAYPVSELDAAEVREALANLRSLDRDEWAAAWSAIGDRGLRIRGAVVQGGPVEDVFLLMRAGSPKDVWINPQGGHMGRGAALSDQKIFETVTLPWVVRALK